MKMNKLDALLKRCKQAIDEDNPEASNDEEHDCLVELIEYVELAKDLTKDEPVSWRKACRLYRKLHDGLSDMVESGRLEESDIPEDWQWFLDTMIKIAAADPMISPLDKLFVPHQGE
jgi:hypothetical protein